MISLTFGVGIGLGFAQALMPVAVKELRWNDAYHSLS